MDLLWHEASPWWPSWFCDPLTDTGLIINVTLLLSCYNKSKCLLSKVKTDHLFVAKYCHLNNRHKQTELKRAWLELDTHTEEIMLSSSDCVCSNSICHFISELLPLCLCLFLLLLKQKFQSCILKMIVIQHLTLFIG